MLGRCRRFVSFTVIVCAIGPVAARPSAKLLDDAPVSRVVDGRTIDATIRAHLDAVPVPGVAVAVTRGDRVLVAQGYGHTPGGDPIGQHTAMAVASVSKSFTALAVMQLVEAGRVDLDRPVRVYLPEFAMADSRVDQVTVRQLLNQTSGLSDAVVSRFQPSATALATRARGWYSHCTACCDAGIQMGGTTIPITRLPLRMVEVVSGMAFDAYLRQHVFGPLGMATAERSTPRTISRQVLAGTWSFGRPSRGA